MLLEVVLCRVRAAVLDSGVLCRAPALCRAPSLCRAPALRPAKIMVVIHQHACMLDNDSSSTGKKLEISLVCSFAARRCVAPRRCVVPRWCIVPSLKLDLATTCVCVLVEQRFELHCQRSCLGAASAM